ncbi:formin-like protein 4 isoform X2 [Cucumis melo var. makuwa]|uniref:Formin-like protein 4 isoform X2 n=1 Tax=Cucumis melo var. makuwa TaxID=1194695 RepID=A0A5A7VLG0_CUCMM|nr:formin-like protein 4 isoform X2 [Cucumis melo var. makuwa]
MTLQLKHENTVTNEWHEIRIGLVYLIDGNEKILRVDLKQILRHDLNFHSPIEKEDGKEVSEIELFQLTHSNEKNGWVNEAKEKYDGRVELKTTSSQEGSEPLLEREICDRVLGKRSGHVKGQGWGPRPKNARNETIQHNTKEANAQIAHLQSIVNSQQATIEAILRRLSCQEATSNMERSSEQSNDSQQLW